MNDKKTKLLIVTPIHKGIDDLTRMSIDELYIPDNWQVDYFRPFVGYSQNDDNDNPDVLGRNNLLEKYKKARQIVLQQGYDYMLVIEEDNVVPNDTINQLLYCGSDVAYGTYVFGRMPLLVSCWIGINEDTLVGYPISSFPYLYNSKWDTIIDSDGVGFGCVLIKRKVLEVIDFRIDWSIDNPPHNDMTFSSDCIKYGFTQRHNLACKVGHIKPYNEIGLPIKSIMLPEKPTKDNFRVCYKFIDYETVMSNI